VPIVWPSAVVETPSHRRLRPAVGIAAAAGIAVLTLSVMPTRDRPTLAAFVQDVKPAPRVTSKAPTPQPPPAQVKPARKARVAAPKEPPVTRTVRTPPAAKPAPAPLPKPKVAAKPKPRPTPAPAPKRTYAWKPFTGAVYYQVSFVRNGATFYATQTRAPRIRLPARLKLGPGRYRWTVRPAIVADLGIRLADPIIRRAFLVRRD
jgi:outer membrane biosynthesis protein TonB